MSALTSTPEAAIERPSDAILQTTLNLGALEVSTFLSLILYGVFLSQVYTFFTASRGDSLWLKFMIGLLLFLETGHSFTASQTIYSDTVTHFKTKQLSSYPLATTVLLETLVTLIVHSFFAHRIHKLSKRFVLAIICLTLGFLRFLGGLVLVIEQYKDVPNVPNGVAYVTKWAWLITAALTVGATLDITIALSMSFYLRKLASPGNFRSTAEIINRLVRWSLQTGLLTSFVSILVVISFQSMANLVWFGVYIFLAKLYSNALLVSLNARPMKQGTVNAYSEPVTGTELQFGSALRPTFNISLHLPTTGLGMESQINRSIPTPFRAEKQPQLQV